MGTVAGRIEAARVEMGVDSECLSRAESAADLGRRRGEPGVGRERGPVDGDEGAADVRATRPTDADATVEGAPLCAGPRQLAFRNGPPRRGPLQPSSRR